MTNQNNAAQAAATILTYLGFAQAASMEPGVDRRRDHIQSLIESVVLRAPVAGKPQSDVNAAMASEYQRWIAYYHQGRDYDSFLKECVFAAPQASEAECSCPSGDGSRRHPCAVHLGTSEQCGGDAHVSPTNN